MLIRIRKVDNVILFERERIMGLQVKDPRPNI